MQPHGSRPNLTVRRAANTVMFGMLIATGISLSLMLAGRMELALQFCGVSAVVLVILLLIGAYTVAKSR